MRNTKIFQTLFSTYIFLLFTFLNSVNAEDYGPFYFLWQGTYALNTKYDVVSGYYPIMTYLPPTTLIFLKDIPVKSISGKRYKHVITQHGQQLLIHESVISELPFRKIYGDQNIIFHKNSYICPEENKNCEEGIDITRGDVLELLSKDEYFVKLKKIHIRGEHKRELIGYLSTDKFETSEYEGVLTDASKQYPRYLHVSTKKIESLCTKCGETKKDVNIDSLSAEINKKISPTGLIPLLKEIFSIEVTGIIKNENQKVVEVSYGGSDIAIDYYVVTILYPGEQGNFQNGEKRIFNIYSKSKCIMPDKRKLFIETITINEKNNFVGMLSFESINGSIFSPMEDISERCGPYKIYKKNFAKPFLTSINSRKHYYKALKHWIEQVEDVSIAHIMMGLFNATCPERDKKGKPLRVKCAKYLSVPSE